MWKPLTVGAALAVVALTAISQNAAARDNSNRSDGGGQRFGEQERYMGQYCDRNPRDRDCSDWSNNRSNWDEDRYHSWYNNHHREFGGDQAAAAIFGFAAGAIASGVAGVSGDAHVANCESRYRSYDRGSDMYMGFDGKRHMCRL